MKPRIIKIRKIFAKIGLFSSIFFFVTFLVYLLGQWNQYVPFCAALVIISIGITIASVIIALVLTIIFDSLQQKIVSLLAVILIIMYGKYLIPVLIAVWNHSLTYR